MTKRQSSHSRAVAPRQLGLPKRGLPHLDGSVQASSLVNRIGREIVGGAFAQESLLPNESTMLEVSRTALREAYSKLTAKGLISARPRVGTSVRPKLDWNMLDPEVLNWHLQTIPADEIAEKLYALRRMIEPGASEMAAENHTEADLERIEAAYQDMRANAAREADLIDADLRFHLAILQATQNPFLNAFSAVIHAAMVSTFELSWRGAEIIRQKRLEQHGAVAEAIANRQAALARQRMEQLLADSIQDVSDALQARESASKAVGQG